MLRSSQSRPVLYVHQQVFQALIKIYSLVDCPIYSVVKYRPRLALLADPPQQILGLFPTQCSAPCNFRLIANRIAIVAVDAQHHVGFGGADRDRTGGLLVANQALSQLSYSPTTLTSFWFQVSRYTKLETRNLILVGLDRLELSTSPLSGVRSSHLSYRPGMSIPGA
jgi:hypothetical protein